MQSAVVTATLIRMQRGYNGYPIVLYNKAVCRLLSNPALTQSNGASETRGDGTAHIALVRLYARDCLDCVVFKRDVFVGEYAHHHRVEARAFVRAALAQRAFVLKA